MAAPFALPAGLAYANRPETLEEKKVMQDYGPIDETFFDYDKYYADREEASKIGDKINMSDALFMDPESGTYPKMFGRTEDRDKLAAIAAAETEKKVGEEVDDGIGGLSIEERIAKIQAEEKAKYQDMIDMAMGTKGKKSAKEEIAENKEIFEEALGGGKDAMIQDASDMALSFAGKALKEGATTKSAFGEFFEEESKRPSRKSKVSDAAANAAIQAYLTGEKSYNDTMRALEVNQAGIDYKTKVDSEIKKAATITDYVVADAGRSSPSKVIATGARKVIEANKLGTQGLQIINKKQAADPELLTKENEGEVFMDNDNLEVFIIIDIGNGNFDKKYLYR